MRREFFELTEGQLEAMLAAARADNPRIALTVGADLEIECQITRSRSGGRHLYVTTHGAGDRLLHIARDGNVAEVEGTV